MVDRNPCARFIFSVLSQEKKRKERKRGVAKEGKARKAGGEGSKDRLDHAKSYYISLLLLLTHGYVPICLFTIYLSTHLFFP